MIRDRVSCFAVAIQRDADLIRSGSSGDHERTLSILKTKGIEVMPGCSLERLFNPNGARWIR